MLVCACLYLCMQAGNHGARRKRKQTQVVAGLRVKLYGNTISSGLTLPSSLSGQSTPTTPLLLSLSASIPPFLLATARWLKKWAWPQVNPSVYLSDPSRRTSLLQPWTLGILLTAADNPTCNIKASWCNHWAYCICGEKLNGNSKWIRKNTLYLKSRSWSWKF